MEYTEPVISNTLKKYRVMLPDGSLRQVDIEKPANKPLGKGPIMAPEVIDKLVSADKTPNRAWLDWIFHQAAGGEKGMQQREASIQAIKDRFIDERINGFQHPETLEFIPKISRQDAEKRWAKAEPRFRDLLMVVGQDECENLGAYGYFRFWPGNNSVYAHVVSAITRFQKFYTKLLQMNKELVRESKPPMPTQPEEIKTFEEMDRICSKVERYFASKAARDDIRLSGSPKRKDDLIYDDDYITALAPLTWAAAVRYGFDAWAWANRDAFEEVLDSDENRDFRNEWKTRTGRGKVFVYLAFKVPVPVWVSRVQSTFKRNELTNLALELDSSNLSNLTDTDSLVVYDEENRNTLSLGDVKQMILNEPGRVDASDEEIPIKRGANVYKTKEEAEEVVRHLDMAMEAVVAWAAQFDPKAIKQDATKLD